MLGGEAEGCLTRRGVEEVEFDVLEGFRAKVGVPERLTCRLSGRPGGVEII